MLISCPVLSLWGADFESIGQAFDMKAVWGSMASDLSALAIDRCGHLCQEEQPEESSMPPSPNFSSHGSNKARHPRSARTTHPLGKRQGQETSAVCCF